MRAPAFTPARSFLLFLFSPLLFILLNPPAPTLAKDPGQLRTGLTACSGLQRLEEGFACVRGWQPEGRAGKGSNHPPRCAITITCIVSPWNPLMGAFLSRALTTAEG